MVKWDSWWTIHLGWIKTVLGNDEPRWLKKSSVPLRRVWSESSRWCVSHDPGTSAEKTYQHLNGVIHIHIIYVSYWGNFSPNTIWKNYITMIQVVDPMLILLFFTTDSWHLLVRWRYQVHYLIAKDTLDATWWSGLIKQNCLMLQKSRPKKNPEDERYPGTCPAWRFGWFHHFPFFSCEMAVGSSC